MSTFSRYLIPLLLIAHLGTVCAQNAASTSEPSITVRKLDQGELTEVIQILKTRYTDSAAVTEKQLNAAALEGIVARLSPAIQILDKPPGQVSLPPLPSGPRFELIGSQVGYIYVADFNEQALITLQAALKKFPVTTRGIVIDLRFSRGGDFKLAADAASLFLGSNRELFFLRGMKEEEGQRFLSANVVKPNLDTPLILVTNRETSGAAEVFAAILKDQGRALIAGEKTAGHAAKFTEVPLSSGRWLRVAIQRVVPKNGLAVFPSGLVPELEITAKPEIQRECLAQAAKQSMAVLVIETPKRKKLNEANLVANEDPEIDQLLEKNQKGKNKNTPPLRDTMIQRAVDIIKGIGILGGLSK